MDALISITIMLFQTVNMLVIIWFILGLMFAFNVINSRNEFLYQIHQSIAALFEPVLRPIRRILPDTGQIDFSPMVLLFGLYALTQILTGLR